MEYRKAKAGAQPPLLPDGEEEDDWRKEEDDDMEDSLPPAFSASAEAEAAGPPKSTVSHVELTVPQETEELEGREEESKRHSNVVFIGHVDAGKSTTGGHILLLSGQVDDRTMQKYERESKEKNRESWYMAYIMDTNEEERIKDNIIPIKSLAFNSGRLLLRFYYKRYNSLPKLRFVTEEADKKRIM
ncbi:hypothetical protein KFK09_001183 [Dendrobium nobile]|uniref:Tr-type G domain-containing protein n=1 Tax=Dendrobium nobile TaxID=94219 RepID=A0A8T3C9M2_DENNO|nr:hypothetical protein KFK09_001183 [Dendrobium nobile]